MKQGKIVDQWEHSILVLSTESEEQGLDDIPGADESGKVFHSQIRGLRWVVSTVKGEVEGLVMSM